MGMKTKNCVVCHKPSNGSMGGHVHYKGERIIASFCSDPCLNTEPTHGHVCDGCYGNWTEAMGKEDDGIRVGYLAVNS